ncbi:hypothetical protein ABK040_007399 [Willaertia magna]
MFIEIIVFVLNKEIQDKAREEIRTVLGNRNPTFDDYDSLNYINAIIYEGLRFHPPVAVVVKEAKKDVQIDNVYENAGITIAPGNLKVLVKNN